MDDSVIKVLRRNGSWNKAHNVTDEKEISRSDLTKKNEYSLDQNFGVLAEEIKKRMKQRIQNDKVSDELNTPNKTFLKEENKRNKIIKNSVKKKLLPYLKEIEKLVNKREMYIDKVKDIDSDLDEVKASINSIKQSYKNNIRELQENINFFDESIEVIDNVKGEN